MSTLFLSSIGHTTPWGFLLNKQIISSPLRGAINSLRTQSNSYIFLVYFPVQHQTHSRLAKKKKKLLIIAVFFLPHRMPKCQVFVQQIVESLMIPRSQIFRCFLEISVIGYKSILATNKVQKSSKEWWLTPTSRP